MKVLGYKSTLCQPQKTLATVHKFVLLLLFPSFYVYTNLYLLKWNFEREGLVIIGIERALLYRSLLLLDTLTI